MAPFWLDLRLGTEELLDAYPVQDEHRPFANVACWRTENEGSICSGHAGRVAATARRRADNHKSSKMDLVMLRLLAAIVSCHSG